MTRHPFAQIAETGIGNRRKIRIKAIVSYTKSRVQNGRCAAAINRLPVLDGRLSHTDVYRRGLGIGPDRRKVVSSPGNPPIDAIDNRARARRLDHE
jgi:hypothetical protein